MSKSRNRQIIEMNTGRSTNYVVESQADWGDRLRTTVKIELTGEDDIPAPNNKRFTVWLVHRIALDMTHEQRKAVAAMLVADRLAGE